MYLLSGFCFIDFTFDMLSNGVINKNFTLETSGLPFALFCHLAQLNPVIKPNSHFQLHTQCLAGKGIATCHNCKEVSCYEICQQLLQVLHMIL